MAQLTNDKHREFRVRKIPEELYKQFKIVSVLKELNMNELFLEAITEVVKKNNKQT